MQNVEEYRPLGKIVLDEAEKNDVYAIVRLQDKRLINITIKNGNTESVTDIPDKGIGIHVFTKEGYSGFASTNRLNKENVGTTAQLAIRSANESSKHKNVKKNKEVFDLESCNAKFIQETRYKMEDKTLAEQENIVKEIEKETRSLDERLSVTSRHICAMEEWLIMRSDGTEVVYTMPYSALYQTLTLKEGKQITELFAKIGGMDLDVLLDEDKRHLFDKKVKKAVKLSSELLNAGIIKGGHYKALLSHEFLGLFAHEAVGHGVETDSMKNSVFGKNGILRKGEKVAPSNISYIDGPVPGLWGNQFVSDNGVERKTVTFIKDGVLTDALSDVFSAKEAGVDINGCGRAQFYYHIPIPRMSVTRIVDDNPIPLEKPFEDMTLDETYEILVRHGELKEGEKIVYPVVGMGGQVNPFDGDMFMFNCAGMYLIENPKKITLYKASSFSGNILGVIATKMKGLGKELCLDNIGRCGKERQGAPVTDGGNPLFIVDKSKHIVFGGK